MERTFIDGGPEWFDKAKAQEFDEDTDWNGNNFISVNTGSQWEHERLYKTARGRWVLKSWSNWQGTATTYSFIDSEEAQLWLAKNGHKCDEKTLAKHEN
jgi:hypothetical protein